MIATRTDNSLLMTWVIRSKVNRKLKDLHQVTPLDLVVLCYVHTYLLGNPTRKQLMACKLGTKRNVEEAVKNVVALGYVEMVFVSVRQSRRMRLTGKGEAVVGELSRQIRRTVRELERGV